MAIHVRCRNGHYLRIKDKYAGKTGRCPHCFERIYVPTKDECYDSEIMDSLDSSDSVLAGASIHDDSPDADDGISIVGSADLSGMKICLFCGEMLTAAFENCPECGGPLRNACVEDVSKE